MAKVTRQGDQFDIELSEKEMFDSFSIIVSNEAPVIRYIDIVEFFSILQTKSIWFSRPDQFSDEYEGFSTISQTQDARKYADIFRKMSVVSCWNHFTSESFALWRIYMSGSKYGVAIVSTVGDFINSLTDHHEKANMKPFGVQYVNHDYSIDGINQDIAITRKKSFYDFEQEIRFASRLGGPEQPEGRSISIEPNHCIKEVICSPYMPPWVKHLLSETMKMYGYNTTVIRDSIVKDTMLK